jgi:hypothetical protein
MSLVVRRSRVLDLSASDPTNAPVQGHQRLLDVRPLIVPALLLSVGAVAYGQYVTAGGFYSDDWALLDAYRNLPDPGFWTFVRDSASGLRDKPLLPVLLAVLPGTFGGSVAAWLTMAVALAVLTAWAWYATMRTLGLPRVHAAAVSALALIAPWSSSTRLWPTASLNNIAVCLFLLGLMLALHSLRLPGWRGRLRHGAAVALYVSSVLSYQIAATAALAAGALYLVRGPRRTALLRWGVDVVVVSLAIAWSGSRTEKDIHGLGDVLRFAPHFALDGARLLGDVVLPFGVGRVAGLAFVLVVAVAALVHLMHRHTPDELRRQLRLWLSISAGGLLATAAAYAILLPLVDYTPLSAGLDDRGNLLASLPLTLAVYAVWVLAGILLSRRRVTVPVALVISVALGVGYLVQLHGQERAWERSAELQTAVLDTLRSSPPPPPGSTMYVFGLPTDVAPGIVVFGDTWALNGAVRLTYGNPTLRAYPVLGGSRVSCGAGAFLPEFLPGAGYNLAADRPDPDFPYGPQYDDVDHGARYGRVVFVDASTGQVTPVHDRAGCLAALPPIPPAAVHSSP